MNEYIHTHLSLLFSNRKNECDRPAGAPPAHTDSFYAYVHQPFQSMGPYKCVKWLMHVRIERETKMQTRPRLPAALVLFSRLLLGFELFWGGGGICIALELRTPLSRERRKKGGGAGSSSQVSDYSVLWSI